MGNVSVYYTKTERTFLLWVLRKELSGSKIAYGNGKDRTQHGIDYLAKSWAVGGSL
jgi:hypothetical protein